MLACSISRRRRLGSSRGSSRSRSRSRWKLSKCRRRAPPSGRRLTSSSFTLSSMTCSRHCDATHAYRRASSTRWRRCTPLPHPARTHPLSHSPSTIPLALPSTLLSTLTPPPPPHPFHPQPQLHPHQVKKVFLALPAEIQARVLLTAIRHPRARPSAGGTHTCPPAQSGAGLADASSQAEIVRDLLAAGGVVAVQLAPALALALALALAPTPTPTLTRWRRRPPQPPQT